MSRARGTTTIAPARKPTLFSRLIHPNTTPGTRSRHHRTIHQRSRATGPVPMSTHQHARTKPILQRSRTKPTLGARIHGMAKRVLGSVTGNRRKIREGRAMTNGAGPGTRRRRMFK